MVKYEDGIKNILIMTLVMLFVTVFTFPVTAINSNVVSIADITAANGSETKVPIMLYNATGVTYVEINLSYDSGIVQVNGTQIQIGDFNNTIHSFTDNALGYVEITTWIRGPGLSGNLIIANITLNAVGSHGKSPLNLIIISMTYYDEESGNDIEIFPRSTQNGTFKIISNSDIKINDTKIRFHNFVGGDPWNITINNASNGKLAYQFNGTIGENNTTISGNDWFVYFGNDGNLNNGVQKCIFPATYNISVNGTTYGEPIERNGQITVMVNEACQPTINPVPEISRIILILTGILGIILVMKKYRDN